MNKHYALLLGTLASLPLALYGAKAAAPLATAAATPEAVAEAAPAAADPFSFFLQEAQVVTASRRAQKKSDSPVAIDVITREEIEKSGARNVPDVLRFHVGMDVYETSTIEGNPYLLNVRGLPEEFTNSLQVLVDGRSIVNGLNSGVVWNRLPVALQDIERIEIVRGPNAALFGANAGQGVINILTKKPGDGGGMQSALGTRGNLSTHLALDGKVEGGMGVRASIGNERLGSYPKVNGDDPVNGNAVNRADRINVRADAPLWEGGSLDLSAGLFDTLVRFPGALGLGGSAGYKNNFILAKLNHSLTEDHGLELNLSRKQDESTASTSSGQELAYEGDLILRSSLIEDSLQVSLGSSLRYAEFYYPAVFSNADGSPSLYAYTRNSNETTKVNHLARAYASAQMAMTEWLSVALAGSAESSDTGAQQPAYQGAIILKPLEDWSMRVSASHSPTMPSMIQRFGRLELVTGFNAAPPTYSVYRVEGTSIYPTQISNYEATLAGAILDRKLSAEVTAYQMEISGIPEFVITSNYSFPFVAFPTVIGKNVTFLVFRNRVNAVVRGLETSLTLRPMQGLRLDLNHTYEDVYLDNATSRYNYVTPWNKVNASLLADLPWGFNVGGRVGWQGQHIVNNTANNSQSLIPDQAKVDLRLGYKPIAAFEAYVSALNLDHAFRTEGLDGLAVPQTYYAGVNIAFGGR